MSMIVVTNIFYYNLFLILNPVTFCFRIQPEPNPPFFLDPVPEPESDAGTSLKNTYLNFALAFKLFK